MTLAQIVGSAASGAATSVRLTSCARSSTTSSVAASTNPANDSDGPRPVSGTAPTARANSDQAQGMRQHADGEQRDTPRTGAPTGRANGVAASAAAPM